MEWTQEQQRAIELRDKNILVAAAAGSGKTAVLVERIKRLILEDKCPIDRMLIVTFTNAAAAEMKEKIEKAIRKAIEDGESDEDRRNLKRQLDLLPRANISTFHAFAIEVIHRYFYLIGGEPNFKICDETQKAILVQNSVKQLTEELYEEGSPAFYDFLNHHSGDRNDNQFKDYVKSIYNTIQSLPEPMDWFEAAVEKINPAKGADFQNSDIMEYIWKETQEMVQRAWENLKEMGDWLSHVGMGEEVKNLWKADMAMLTPINEAADSKDFSAMKKALEAFNFASMAAKYTKPENNPEATVTMEEAKAHYKGVREEIKTVPDKLKENFFYVDFETVTEELSKTYDDSKFLMETVQRFGEIFREEKRKKNLLDFNDIEHFAYEILKNQEAAEHYKEKFKYIFIDEYQDSNVLQEALIGRIKGERNLFMVGDIKQSIYKFRLAEPEIFRARYEEFAEAMKRDGENSPSEKIDLNKNFRSKAPIISFINQVFEPIMKGYDEDAALYVGDTYGDRCGFEPKLYLCNKLWDEDQDLDKELKELKKTEKEALAAVHIIKEHLGKTIFDSRKGEERPLKKRDVVILLRGLKDKGDLYYKILSENGIPTFVNDNDGYFDTIEINTFMSLLALLDNEKQDIPLLAVMRSEILGFTIDEMVDIRLMTKKGSYHHALREYAQEGSQVQLREKCIETFTKLEKWRNMSLLLPLEDLVWELLLDTGFYTAMGAMPGGMQRQANLRALVDKALSYRRSQGSGLYGFMQYIEAVKAGKVQIGQIKLVGEDEDVVRIMTIHKSKGLEFPMVLVGGYCGTLTYDNFSGVPAVHKDLGVGLNMVDYEGNWFKSTILQNAIKLKVRQEEAEEQQRVLYVAMTRAKDILALLGTVDDVDKARGKAKESLYKDTSYFAMTGKTICNMPGATKEIRDYDLQNLTRAKKLSSSKALKLLDEAPGHIGEETRLKMEFAYPYMDDFTTKSKYSVSDLNADSKESRQDALPAPGQEESKASDLGKSINLKEPESFSINRKLDSRSIGVITHKVLEKMDFARAGDEKEGTAYLKQLLADMERDAFLTAEETEVVDTGILARFAGSPLGRRIAAAQKVGALRREQPFNLKMQVEGRDTIVQGVIDCCFEEGGQLVLVDYKTTNVKGTDFPRKKEEIKGHYETQIRIYRKALVAALGKRVKEAYLYLTNINEAVEM